MALPLSVSLVVAGLPSRNMNEDPPPQPQPASQDASAPSASEPKSPPASIRCKRLRSLPSLLVSNWKGLLFVSVLIVMMVLSGTVLKRPVERAAVWLRGRGEEGYALFGAVGYLLIMVGGSTTVFEVLAGYVYGLQSGGSCISTFG